jgi:hypothetical protein
MAALIADRVRFNLRNAAAAARLHPTGLAIPLAVLTGGAILYGLMVTVSIRIGPSSPQAGQVRLPLSVATAPAGSSQPAARTGPTSASRLTGSVASGSSGVPGSTGPGGVAPGSRQVVGARPDPSWGPTPSPTGSTPPPSTSPPGHPSPPPTTGPPSPSPSPSPTRHHGGGNGGICLNLGLLGICLKL